MGTEPDKTTITINLIMPSDAKLIIRAMRRAVGFFKSIVEGERSVKKP